MSQRELVEVHPFDLCISAVNEREEVVLGDDFVESIANRGVLKPPVVRPTDQSGYLYEVIDGQRRTMAAQDVSLESMEVIVSDYDDIQAGVISIVENIDEFREQVPLKNRASAVYDIKERAGWTLDETADQFDVSHATISTWLECTRDEWEGTSIHHEEEGPIDLDDIPQRTIATVRNTVGGGVDGEEALYIIWRESLRQKDVYEASQLAQMDNHKSFLEHLEDMGEKRRQERQTDISERVNVDVTWTGDIAEIIRQQSADSGQTTEQFVHQVVCDSVADSDEDGTVNINIDNF